MTGTNIGERVLNTEVIKRRMNALLADKDAVSKLTRSGLKRETLEVLRAGIADRQTGKKSTAYRRAIAIPHRRADGSTSKYVYINIEGVTENGPKGIWSTGEAETYYAEEACGQSTVIVCDMRELLAIKQFVTSTPEQPNVQLIASTSVEMPLEWSSPAFWERWENIYAAPSTESVDLPLRILRCASKPVMQLAPDSSGSWFERLASGGAKTEFARAFQTAMEVAEHVSTREEKGIGRFAYEPVDVGRAFHGGHLYYPVRTLVREMHVDKSGNPAEVQSVENVVVRSDGRVLTAKQMPAKPGTPSDARVWRLTDGTLIDEAPAPSKTASWNWNSIQQFMEAKRKGDRIARDLSSLIDDVVSALREAIWLPNDDDYTMLGLVVVASYVQSIFKAIPYVLVCGDAGTGKSQLGIALSQLGCNGNVIGQVSAASAARTMHEGRGLTIFDDLEGIGPGKRGNDGSFTEFIQWLKVSYNADTAKKPWTDSSAGFKVRTLNGFGIKVINNTLGVDSILGSRMIRISTQRMPAETAAKQRSRRPVHRNLAKLRDELHIWAFESVNEVVHVYREQVAPSKRDEEIAAPLRVLAILAGDNEIKTKLESSLSASVRIATIENDSPQDIVREAVNNLVKRGQYWVSASLVSMEARRLVGPNFGKSHTAELTEIDDEKIVGRYLVSLGLVEQQQTRARVHGVQMRFAKVREHVLQEVFNDGTRPDDVGVQGFCASCDGCPYAAQNCGIRSRRRSST